MSENTSNKSQFYGIVVKVLSSLSIPIFLWAISLQADVSNLKKDMEICMAMEDKISKIEENTRTNSILIERVKVGLEHVHDSISGIRASLN
jgi:hypothetical protein